MSGIMAGDPVLVVEHADDGSPRPDGRKFRAKVTGNEGIYFQVRYDDPAVFAGRTDIFYQESRWRAWDGEMRWRLEMASEDETAAVTAGEDQQ